MVFWQHWLTRPKPAASLSAVLRRKPIHVSCRPCLPVAKPVRLVGCPDCVWGQISQRFGTQGCVLQVMRFHHKVRHAAFCPAVPRGCKACITAAISNNMLEVLPNIQAACQCQKPCVPGIQLRGTGSMPVSACSALLDSFSDISMLVSASDVPADSPGGLNPPAWTSGAHCSGPTSGSKVERLSAELASPPYEA